MPKPKPKTLVIFTRLLGSEQETYIRRHVRDLYAGKRVVIALDWSVTSHRPWRTGCPTLLLRWHSSRDRARLIEEFLRRHKVTHVLAEYLDTSLEIWPIARKLGLKFYLHAHGGDVSQILPKKTLKAYREYNLSDGVIVVSRRQRELLIRKGIRPGKIRVIPCGVDIPASRSGSGTAKRIRCLAVGRMVPGKDPLSLLESFRLAQCEEPRLTLDFVGVGPFWKQVCDYVRKHRLEKSVRIWGLLPNRTVLRMMRRSDIFLQHSRVHPKTRSEEGLPVAILEAMAQSLPVISTVHAGIPEAVLHGRTGLLSAEGDPRGMARNIVRLAESLKLRKKMGRAGHRRAKALYSWKRERARLLRWMGLAQR